VDGVKKRVVLTDYHDRKAYRERKDKYPRGLEEEEGPDLCFGWFFFRESIEDSSFVRIWEVGSFGDIIIRFSMY
jgi:hypothetical protein